MRISRRRFVTGTVALAGSVAAADLGRALAQVIQSPLPNPAASGIQHVVLVMMENRSFDHLLGWLPGADGTQAGLTYVDNNGVPHATHRLAPDFQGCAHPDPDHSYQGGRVEYNSTRCDGWLRAGANDVQAIGYYTDDDLSFLGTAAPTWTVCDRYFAAIMAPTFPNRLYQHAAQTDRLTNATTRTTLPTIWDRLAAHGLSGRYYFNDVPFLALWGPTYLPISRPFAAFLADCAAGTLPHVSFVDPRFTDEDSGTSSDDHPRADIRSGETFLNQVYAAITSSPNWSSTVLVINYDEWGGFFDHVPPSQTPIPAADQVAGNADGLRGFRVPCLAIAPWAPRSAVARGVYDHTSVLKMIEWRWGLAPLTVRDATANNLAEVLDFSRPSLAAPAVAVPPSPIGVPCPAGALLPSGQPVPAGEEEDEWAALRLIARDDGWPV